MNPKEPTIQVAPRQVLADHVYDELLVSLMDGRLEAGAPINIDAISRGTQVSQTPIREALARLEATGLVRRTALKGYRVAPLFTTEELIELMDARLVLEPVNAYLACSRSTTGLIAQLEQSIRDLSFAPRGPSFSVYRSYWEADERFHQLIAEHAHNQFLYSAYSTLGGQVQRFRLFGDSQVTDGDHAIREHTKIVAAFEDADPEAARSSMVEHIKGVKSRAVIERLARPDLEVRPDFD